MGKQATLASLLFHSGITGLLRRLNVGGDRLKILAYHRVADVPAGYPFDRHLISAKPEEFEWQMQYLKEHYYPLSFSQLRSILDSNEKVPDRSAIVTFDDGFLDNYDIVYPILEKYQVPATFFLSTGYIGNSEHYWFEIAVLFCNLQKEDLQLDAANSGMTHILKMSEPLLPRQYNLLRFLKEITNEDRLQLVKFLESRIDFDAVDESLSRSMSWEQVKELNQSGLVEIGSHTITHPVLSKVQHTSLQDELSGSKSTIEEKLGVPCTVLAYPVGGPDAINVNVLKAVTDADYQFAVTYQSGDNVLPFKNKYQLKRVAVELEISRAQFANLLLFPSMFSYE